MESITSQNPLSISEEGLSHLASMRKWAFFLSIMGFIGSGFMVLFGLFFGAISNTLNESSEVGVFPTFLIMVLYTLIGLLYLFPSFFLLKFSTNMKLAIEAKLDIPLTDAMRYLRLLFVFFGVLTITTLCLLVLFMAGGIVTAILGAIAANT